VSAGPGPTHPQAAVSSRHNPRFKAAAALREARERQRRSLTLVDGAREIGRALDAGRRPAEAWVASERLRSDAALALLPRLAAQTELVETTPELLARLAYGQRDEGIVAIFALPSTALHDLGQRLPADPLIAVVEQVEKPGNLGALLRCADGAGAHGVIVADPVSDVWNPNAIRASLGTIFSLPLAVCSSSEALAFLRAHHVTVLAARVDGTQEYTSVDLTGPVALVVGAEANGLSQAWSGPDVDTVRIPMRGLADSLNVSASAAVLLYEALRQRGTRGS
jgi:TrmH family RNA methyltransferase